LCKEGSIRRKEFSDETRIKCLLWSNRQCCLCGKSCGTDIEIHHIDREDDNSLENAIPLCYNCHAKVHRAAPMGSKYRPEELRKRRDQIYDEYTLSLVSPTPFEITQIIRDNPNIPPRQLPDVGFNISHEGNTYPLRAKIKLSIYLGDKFITLGQSGYYNGTITWHLNPLTRFYGHFSLPAECMNSNERLTIEGKVTVIDIYDREHKLLPVCYTYVRPPRNYWFFEPTEFAQLKLK
jgi:hypothetical protein